MVIINKLEDLFIEDKSAIAIGKFDGIHLGHIELLNKILNKKKSGYLAVVFTFNIQAASFFGDPNIKDITTIEEKRLIFEEMGIDVLIEYPLNKETASVLPDYFVSDILVRQLNMKYIAAGNDVSFGYKGKGDFELLQNLAPEYGYDVEIIEKVFDGNREISSTYIREEITKGNMKKVSDLLGHPYSFKGTVTKGFQLGQTLGMPTMNLYPEKDKVLPPLGVYYSKVKYNDDCYYGITNIGRRPTVSDSEVISVETYLYDFDKNMYGEIIETELIAFKRKEMKFNGVEELRSQMHKDIAEGREFFDI